MPTQWQYLGLKYEGKSSLPQPQRCLRAKWSTQHGAQGYGSAGTFKVACCFLDAVQALSKCYSGVRGVLRLVYCVQPYFCLVNCIPTNNHVKFKEKNPYVKSTGIYIYPKHRFYSLDITIITYTSYICAHVLGQN